MRIARLLWDIWPFGSKKKIMDPVKKAQIKVQSKAQSGALIGVLIFYKAPNNILAEYSDYSNIFSVENAAELPENTGMNKHVIKLEESKQQSFGSIYNLEPVKLETLKTYIKTNLANSFIRPSNSPAGAPILLTRSQIDVCVFAWIIGVSTIYSSKINIYCLWLVNC